MSSLEIRIECDGRYDLLLVNEEIYRLISESVFNRIPMHGRCVAGSEPTRGLCTTDVISERCMSLS